MLRDGCRPEFNSGAGHQRNALYRITCARRHDERRMMGRMRSYPSRILSKVTLLYTSYIETKAVLIAEREALVPRCLGVPADHPAALSRNGA